jgi:hypothetical protein
VVSVRANFTWQEIVEKILEKNGETTNREFREWLLTKEFIGYHADYFLWQHGFNIYKKITTEDNDHFTIVSGLEGSGKTVLALILAAMVSPTFSMVHICFSVDDFIRIVKKAKKGDTILLDEGAIFLFSREIMTKTNRRVVKSLNLMRQLNLHIICCIPNFYNLDTYVRKHRVDTFLYIRDSKRTYRGITKQGIRIINEVESSVKDVMNVKMPYGCFWDGYWTKCYPNINDLTEEAYRTKKRNHLDAFLNDISKEMAIEEEVIVSMVKISEFMRVVPLTREIIVANIIKGEIPGIKIGGNWFINGDYYRKIATFRGSGAQIIHTKDETANKPTQPQ